MCRKADLCLPSSATPARLAGSEGELTKMVDDLADGGCDSGDGLFESAGGAGEAAVLFTVGAAVGVAVTKMPLEGRDCGFLWCVWVCVCGCRCGGAGFASPFSSASVGAWDAVLGAADEDVALEFVVAGVRGSEEGMAGGSASLLLFLDGTSLSEDPCEVTGSGV